MYINHKVILFLMAFSTGFASAATPGSYNFFQTPSVRMREATDYVKKTIPQNLNNADKLLYAVCETAQAGSVKDLANLYAQLASVTQLRTQQTLDVESQAAYIAIVLEKLRVSYYAELDTLEAAIPYWEWAKNHTTRYTLSQLPHKWFSHEANKARAERAYTTICALREIYSAEFGKIMRLLGQWHEENPDSKVWLAEVHTVIGGILAVDPAKDLSSIELLIKKLAEHEQKVTTMVQSVQAPNWAHQHWMSLAATAAVAGAVAYYGYNNQPVIDSYIKYFRDMSSQNAHVTNFLKSAGHFKDRVSAAYGLVMSLPTKVNKESLDNLKKYMSQSNVAYYLFGGQKGIDEIFVWVNNHDNSIQDLLNRADALLKLCALIVQTGLVYGGYKFSKGAFNWFVKRDRSALVGRLNQTQKVLIRTTHERELSDAEYGRLLYLLTKAYDQVAKNVFSKERAPFLDDLTYIADNQSSIKQKRKTLKSMWRKYRSLERPA